MKLRFGERAARGEVAAFLNGGLARLIELAKMMNVDVHHIRVEVETSDGPYTAHASAERPQ